MTCSFECVNIRKGDAHMNLFSGILNLVCVIIHAVILFGFISGVYYPSKLYMIMTILLTMGVFLTWSANDFERATESSRVGSRHGG